MRISNRTNVPVVFALGVIVITITVALVYCALLGTASVAAPCHGGATPAICPITSYLSLWKQALALFAGVITSVFAFLFIVLVSLSGQNPASVRFQPAHVATGPPLFSLYIQQFLAQGILHPKIYS